MQLQQQRQQEGSFTKPTLRKLINFGVNDSSDLQLSHAEQLRRERMRLFTSGIAMYEWCESKNRLLIPKDSSIFIFDINEDGNDSSKGEISGSLSLIYEGDFIDPHLSPDGNFVAFVSGCDIYTLEINPGNNGGNSDSGIDLKPPQKLTYSESAPKGISYGIADFVAQEEMDRYRGFWWSPDSKSITFCEVDETMIPEYTILHQGKADPAHQEAHRYPFSGKTNPSVRLAVLNLCGKREDTVWMDLIQPQWEDEEYYLARVGWWPDGSIMAQVENRSQTILELLRLDPKSGARNVILQESSDIWINLHNMLRPLSKEYTRLMGSSNEGDFDFIWCSERTGFAQLYLCHFDAVSKQCTSQTLIGPGGDFVISSLNAVREPADRNEKLSLYFTANAHSPLVECLYFAELNGPSLTRLTTKDACHTSTVDSKSMCAMVVQSSIEKSSVMSLFKLDGDSDKMLPLEFTLHSDMYCTRYNAVKHLLNPPIFDCFQVPRNPFSNDQEGGETETLHCAFYTPDASIYGTGPYPTVVSVYGGPHVQMVANRWRLTSDIRAQRLRQNGFLVIKCDNRGSYRRGLAFEGAMKYDMGHIEVYDQTALVNRFVQKGLADSKRVGMIGWSYGGYMSAMSLCRAPKTFTCAIAGAPVTSWDGYDTHYTERYMGTPQNNEKGYNDSSVMTHVANMKGSLMIVHGLIDENVHFRHTARLINELIRCRKKYDLVLFPCERHGPQKLADKVYLEDRIMEYFVEKLSISVDGEMTSSIEFLRDEQSRRIKIPSNL